MKIVEVFVEYNTMQLDRTFTYVSDCENIERGKRVIVPFNYKEIVGFVESVSETHKTKEELEMEMGFNLGVITQVLDVEPLINEELFELAEWMSKETVSSRISCFQAMLPAKLKPISNNQKIKMENWVKINKELEDEKISPKQIEAFSWLLDKGECTLSEYREKFKSVGKALEDKGLVIKFQKEAVFKERNIETTTGFQLTQLQSIAMNDIKKCTQDVVLLHGVTGSGKTEVYLQLAQEIVSQKKQVLILVPEISLTPQMVKRVESRFGSSVAIYHSGLNNQEKYEQFIRVKHNEVDVIVGTRSAIFMPFHELGLIILDEEHDSSYKQDSTPQYHCKDVAIHRAKTHGCKVLLGSATPSLESYARAVKKVYGLCNMPNRINNQMPIVTLVDTQLAMRNNESYILTNALKEKIAERLERSEQVILLLNRRGYSPTMRCNSCKETVMCPHCDVAMSFHRADNSLKCHCCGFSQAIVKECPKCKKKSFSMLGVGTQRLVEEVEKAFPTARIERMDADTTRAKNAHQKILAQVENHEIDVLIGTQMISKGMDYPDVTLVGIINGDAGLNHTDFHSVETTFQLIVQASGRSGRSSKPGEVVIQAFDPNHYAIQLGSKQDYQSFFVKEMNYRHLSFNPPYSFLISIVFSHLNAQVASNEMIKLKNWLMEEEIKVLGPSELFKLQDFNRYRIILKGDDREALLTIVSKSIQMCKELKFKSMIKVDTSPLTLD